jgi:hypothetical protein
MQALQMKISVISEMIPQKFVVTNTHDLMEIKIQKNPQY